jgi:hypothetical protein
MDCPKCHSLVPPGATDCKKCGIIFEKYEHAQSVTMETQRQQQFASPTASPLSPSQNILIPIGAFLFAALIKLVFPALTWSISMIVHEFGHAFSGWWGGVAATPFLGWTSFEAHRTWMTTICFSLLMGILGYKSFEKRSYFLVATFATMFLVHSPCGMGS